MEKMFLKEVSVIHPADINLPKNNQRVLFKAKISIEDIDTRYISSVDGAEFKYTVKDAWDMLS